MVRSVLGIDVGGTQMKWGLVQEGRVRSVHKEKTPPHPKALESRIQRLVQELGPVDAIGIGVPGMVDEEGVVHDPPNLPEFHGFPLKQALEQITGLPVRIENDANLIALGEWKFGAAQGARHAVIMTLGTGIGTGFISDGRLVRGAHGRGAEGGHMILDPDGPPCYCGNRGCLESFLGTVHFIPRARSALAQGPEVPSDLDQLDAAGLYKLAQQGHSVARELWREYGHWLGLGIVNFVHLFGPEVVVLGGGVAGAFDAFAPAMFQTLEQHVIGYPDRHLKVVPAALGMEAGIYGAWALLEDT